MKCHSSVRKYFRNIEYYLIHSLCQYIQSPPSEIYLFMRHTVHRQTYIGLTCSYISLPRYLSQMFSLLFLFHKES
jgi:hypothetical protein